MKRYIKSDSHEVINYSVYEYSIKTDDDFYDCMENYGQDIIDIFEELRPYWRVKYEQYGVAVNTFYVYNDSDAIMVSIKDDDLMEYDNYADIIKFTVNTILEEMAGL